MRAWALSHCLYASSKSALSAEDMIDTVGWVSDIEKFLFPQVKMILVGFEWGAAEPICMSGIKTSVVVRHESMLLIPIRIPLD